jgi:hypothetical protein
MQEQIPSSNPAQVDEQPQYEQTYQEPTFNPENARGMQPPANPMTTPSLAQPPQAPPRPKPAPTPNYQAPAPQPNVVYLRRNLTIAEILIILALSTGILAGVQFAWGFSTDILSRIEIREK